jgi:rhodanese-related sulfurtransferase
MAGPARQHLALRLLWLVLLALSLTGCAHGRSSDGVREAADSYLSSTPENQRIVSPSWLARELASGRTSGLVVVDIRERREFDQGHIASAIHVSFKSAARRETLERLPHGRPLVLVCKSGHTASMLNALWNLLGLHALTLKDGMRGWAAARGPLTQGTDSR